MFDEKGKIVGTLKTIGIVLGLLLTVSSVVGGVMSLIARVAQQDFVTRAALKEHEEVILRQVEARIATNEALASEKEKAVIDLIENMRRAQKESNERLQASINQIYDLLVRERR